MTTTKTEMSELALPKQILRRGPLENQRISTIDRRRGYVTLFSFLPVDLLLTCTIRGYIECILKISWCRDSVFCVPFLIIVDNIGLLYSKIFNVVLM